MKDHLLTIIRLWQNKVSIEQNKYKYFTIHLHREFIGFLFSSLEELTNSINREYNANVSYKDVEKLLLLI
jgi:hypothetical protein